MKWVFVNNNFFEEDKAVVKISDLSIQRGYGVFDFFRTNNHQPLFLDDYLDRFFNSAKELFITVPVNRTQLKTIIFDLIKKNNIPQSGVRITATGGYAPDGYTPAEGNIILQQQSLIPVTKETAATGVRIITYEYTRDLPAVKSINYLMGVWLQKLVKEKKADDVLYFNNDRITEFPRANIFIVNQQGKLLTPGNQVLAGITRKKILEFAPAILPAATADISVKDLKNAAEVFMTSTTKRILSVVAVDGKKIGDGVPGPVTKMLYQRFVDLENDLSE